MECLPLTEPAESARGTECCLRASSHFLVRPREIERTRGALRVAATLPTRTTDSRTTGRKSVPGFLSSPNQRVLLAAALRCTDDEVRAGLGPIDGQPSSRDRHHQCPHRRHYPRRLQRIRRLSAELHRLDHRHLCP